MASGSPWTVDEIATLRRLGPDMTAAAVSLELPGRTPKAAKHRAILLGVSLKKPQRVARMWAPDKILQARSLYDAGESLRGISKAMKCARDAITELRDKHGWPPRTYKYQSRRIRQPLIDAVVAERSSGMMPKAIAARHGLNGNQVAGLLSRYGVGGPPPPRPLSTKRKRRRSGPPRPPCSAVTLPPLVSLASALCAPAVAVVRLPPPPRLIEAFGPPVAPRVFGQCCWPMGEPGTREFRYCDAPMSWSRGRLLR